MKFSSAESEKRAKDLAELARLQAEYPAAALRIADAEVTDDGYGGLDVTLRIKLGPVESAELPEIEGLSPETRESIELAIEAERFELRAVDMARDAYGLEVAR